MKIVDYNAVCSLKFDGKDYPCTGPVMPANSTTGSKRATGATWMCIDVLSRLENDVRQRCFASGNLLETIGWIQSSCSVREVDFESIPREVSPMPAA